MPRRAQGRRGSRTRLPVRKKKQLSQSSLLGQLGVNLIERIVLEMGQVWRPTPVHDTGVDGVIELRDPETAEVSNRQIQVQSKATSGSWESETNEGFVYRVREEDLDYWLRGNLPVILVLSKPSQNEAYWVSVKDYFGDPKSRSARKIEVNKARDLFGPDALARLRATSISVDKGIYKPPLRKKEELVSNLLEVRVVPETLYMAETSFREGKELNNWLCDGEDEAPREWILRNKRVLSFYDLTEPPWKEIVDRGTVEEFSTREWSDTDDEEKSKEWVELLSECLRARLRGERVRFQSNRRYRLFYFAQDEGWESRVYYYLSEQKNTQREVVMPILGKKTGTVICYRHSAMKAQFRRFGGNWYLGVNPTYYYTVNGRRPSALHESQLAGIKRLEHNEAVLGQLVMWERVLTNPGTMFEPEYSWLRFAKLTRFEVNEGIADNMWLPVPEQEATEDESEAEDMLF